MKHLISIAILSIAIAAAPKVFALDPEDENLFERFCHVESFDPTTAFLQLEDAALGEKEALVQDMLGYARNFLGKPYSHGSKGPRAFDCSGFTSFVFGQFGIELSPSSSTQYTQGRPIENEDIRPGDLLFFKGRSASSQRVGHVALAVDVDENGVVTFIHAAISGGVKYDTWPDGGYYSQRYIGAKRVIE